MSLSKGRGDTRVTHLLCAGHFTQQPPLAERFTHIILLFPSAAAEVAIVTPILQMKIRLSKRWSYTLLDLRAQHHPVACQKCRISGATADL